VFLEITTSLIAGGVVGYTYLIQNGSIGNDHHRIVKIAENCGLVNKEKKSIRIHRRTRQKTYTEYVYQLPDGFSVKHFQEKIDCFKDGLNAKRFIFDFSFSDLKQINWKKDIGKQIKALVEKKKRIVKDVEIDFDGMLKFRVYHEPLPELVLFNDEMVEKCKGWEIPVGESRKEFLKHDFDKRPHMIVAGATDYGKSVFLKNIITTLVKRRPTETKFFLIDLKGGLSFNRFRYLSQVQMFAKNPKEAYEALKVAQEKMEERMEYLLENSLEDVKEAGINERYFVIIDEAADIHDDKSCQEIIKDIARRGRGAGFRLIYCTQYPTNETLSPQVRQNCSARLCMRLETAVASRAVLDEVGAEELPLIKGRAIYKTDRKYIVQTPYIDNEYINQTIQPFINIRARGERAEKSESQQRTTRRKYSLVIEEA
jgi:DNA segregation ATPase FtsK/SpoIIIE, S-DNA-T family